MKLIEETDGEYAAYTVEIPLRDYLTICNAFSYLDNFWDRSVDTALFECNDEDVTRIRKDLHSILHGKNTNDEEEG